MTISLSVVWIVELSSLHHVYDVLDVARGSAAIEYMLHLPAGALYIAFYHASEQDAARIAIGVSSHQRFVFSVAVEQAVGVQLDDHADLERAEQRYYRL